MEAKSLSDKTAKLLGARVQTRSMEVVLLPMALQVCSASVLCALGMKLCMVTPPCIGPGGLLIPLLTVSHLPLRAQVSELTLMYQAAGHIHPPSHTMRARTVSDAMDNLINLAKQVGRESHDKVTEHAT